MDVIGQLRHPIETVQAAGNDGEDERDGNISFLHYNHLEIFIVVYNIAILYAEAG